MLIHCTEQIEDMKLFIIFNRVFGTSLKEYKDLSHEEICFLNDCIDEIELEEPEVEECELILSEDDRKFFNDMVKTVNVNCGKC